ncbi:alpha/beta fold hydrolase [Ottowia sp.]|uniref:alpha/beta fold hydrolase n=1 Tax=Ottowia sp. TaxID=1898956 RepID=UPI0039E532BC
MIETWLAELPHGITLSCRAAGERGRPLMMFLHGFPEAAFIWDELLEHFARPEHGGFRCVAPNLRGFERSSAPAEVAAYKAPLLIQDVMALAAQESGGGRIHTLVAHDWGGAFGWGAAQALPDRVGRLVIINSPHPGTFARELRENPAQQAASAYMNWLAKPGSEAVLAQDDYARLFAMFLGMKAGADGFGWLTEAVKQQYRDVWSQGLTGACNLYRVTPLKPPVEGRTTAADIPLLPPERLRVEVPTLVLWALDDIALLPGLLVGLEDYVPKLQVKKLPGATHWVSHEQPQVLAREIGGFIARNP